MDNFWATRGKGGPVLCFAGHTDVVPTGPLEEWKSDPFKPAVRDGLLFGRGAADMKSALAAMVTATEEFVKAHPKHKGTIAYLITSDEEGPSVDGTKRVVETLRERGQKIDWCIVGEPSSEKELGDTIKIGRRGSLSGRLTVHGVQGHIAYPQLAENPVHTFAPALAELTARTWDNGNEHFQPTSFQISNFNAGTGAPNVIPGRAQGAFQSALFTGADHRRAEGHRRGHPQETRRALHARVVHLRRALLYASRARSRRGVTKAIQAETGITPKFSTGGGTSDGRFIAPLGAQVVELGVINATIHKVNESVNVADIDRLHRIYLNTLKEMLA